MADLRNKAAMYTILFVFGLPLSVPPQVQAQQAKTTRSFRITGEIHTTAGIAVAGAEVEFLRHEHTIRVVRTNSKGHYDVTVPLGRYAMRVTGNAGLLEYSRPDFDVNQPRLVVFNITLGIARPTCDLGHIFRVNGPSSDSTAEDVKNACGGSDRFLTPSSKGEQFELGIDYPLRAPNGSGYVYGGANPSNSQEQVRVAYNLFSLQADHVVYDSKDGTITADGSVVIEDGSDKTQHFDSIAYRIENGSVILLNK